MRVIRAFGDRTSITRKGGTVVIRSPMLPSRHTATSATRKRVGLMRILIAGNTLIPSRERTIRSKYTHSLARQRAASHPCSAPRPPRPDTRSRGRQSWSEGIHTHKSEPLCSCSQQSDYTPGPDFALFTRRCLTVFGNLFIFRCRPLVVAIGTAGERKPPAPP